jgi:hypothetical protein
LPGENLVASHRIFLQEGEINTNSTFGEVGDRDRSQYPVQMMLFNDILLIVLRNISPSQTESSLRLLAKYQLKYLHVSLLRIEGQPPRFYLRYQGGSPTHFFPSTHQNAESWVNSISDAQNALTDKGTWEYAEDSLL